MQAQKLTQKECVITMEENNHKRFNDNTEKK